MYLVLAVLLHLFFPVMEINLVNILGIVPLTLGIAINIWADSLLKKYKTTVKPTKKPSKLVKEGIFLYSRNPMYLGFVLILLGVSLLLGSLTTLLAPLLMFITLETKFIPIEEKHLKENLGDEYEAYKTKVGRWFSLPMKISLLPKTKLGGWSVALIIITPVLLRIGMLLAHTIYKLVPAGETILKDIVQRPALALTMLSGMTTGVLAFMVGLTSIIKRREKGILVYLSTLLGMLFSLFLVAEILFPH